MVGEPDFPNSKPTWESIRVLSRLEPGDHVSIDKAPYWHHGIVTDVNIDQQAVTIIGWSLSKR